jgi:hypothetical protein
MNNIPTKALAVGVPVGLLLIAHLKSLPFAYTVRSWFLLRALIKSAKENNLRPGRMYLKSNFINTVLTYLHITNSIILCDYSRP